MDRARKVRPLAFFRNLRQDTNLTNGTRTPLELRKVVLAFLSAGILLAAAITSALRPTLNNSAAAPAAATSASSGLVATALPSVAAPTPTVIRQSPSDRALAAAAEPTSEGAQAAAAGQAAPTEAPFTPTLQGGEADPTTWTEYRLLSWGIAFRYPKQWKVEVRAPQAPGAADIVQVSGGGRTLQLVRQAAGPDLSGAQKQDAIAVGPVSGDKYVWRNAASGRPAAALVVPQARRDAVSLIRYQLLGGAEDPTYLSLFDAVLATLRFDVGVTPVGPDPAFAPYKQRPVTLPSGYKGYALPLDLAQVTNLDAYNLTRAQKDALAANGFFVAAGSEAEFAGLYQSLTRQGQPAFVTTDSVYHAYLLLFDKLLRSAERDHLAPDLLALSKQLLNGAQAAYATAKGSPVEKAAARALAYFSVAVRLQDPQAAIPAAVQDVVQKELALIEAHQGVALSPLMDAPETPADHKYREDYTQYVPRGHYAESEALQRYFKAMTWYGRMDFRLSEREEVRTALIANQVLLRSLVGNRPALSVWESIYEPTTFFAGRSDDLTVYDLRNLATSLWGVLGDDPRLFADNDQLDDLIRTAQAQSAPHINSMWVTLGQDGSAVTRGYRFMGARFTLDSYVLGRLTWNNTGTEAKPRLLPQGLDVAAALGSDEANKLLAESGETSYARYPEQMSKVRQEIGALPQTTWNESLGYGWLYALQPLLAQKDARYPEFMRTVAWQRKNLQTMLGGWTELKHDAVLYAKQPAAKGLAAGAAVIDAGYVEPDPEAYARLAALADLAGAGLDSRALLSEPDRKALQQLAALLARLQAIAEKELAGQALAADDVQFIRDYGQTLADLVRASADVPAGVDASGKLELPQAALVTDVATGGPSVQEEAIGRVNRLVVVVQVGDKLVLAQGGVYSYYEFAWPASDRLTDDKWQAMLQAGQSPLQPAWTKTFTVGEG